MTPTPQTPTTLTEIEAALTRALIGLRFDAINTEHKDAAKLMRSDATTLQLFRDQLPQLFADAGAYREMVAKNELIVEEGPMLEIIKICVNLMLMVEGPGCLRWAAPNGFRLKDTEPWMQFYVATKRMQEQAQALPATAPAKSEN